MVDEIDAPTIAESRLAEGAPIAFEDEGPPGSRYVRSGRLGSGAMGDVHLCVDSRIGREVALKTARVAREDQALLARFVHEARVQAQLEHPSIVPVYDVGHDDRGAPYFTMKRVRGVTLKHVLHKLASGDAAARAQWTRRRLLTAFASVCLTVHYAHTRGVLHRDLKPANVMLGEYGELYVLDWGVARVLRGAAAGRLEASPDLTGAGDLVGTPGFIAPEQLRGEAYDERADVYALGAMLFEILALEPLHAAAGGAVLAAGLGPVDARPSVRAPSRGIAPELDAICAKAAAFDPRERYASARELHDAVDAYLEGDRDLERRRAASAEHARVAEEVARAALATTDPESETRERARAMGEVSRALALDAENEDARRVLFRLLTEPPRRTPPEVEDQLARHQWAQNQRAARGGVIFYGGYFALAPLLLPLLGVRVAWFVWLSAALFAAAALSLAHVALTPYSRPRTRYVSVVLTMLALGSLSGFDGPLILSPMLLTANAVALLMQPNKKRRGVILACAAAGILAPLALEWTGVLPASYALEHGRWIVMDRVMSFTPATLDCLGVLTVVLVLAIGVYFLRFRDILTDAERRLHLYTWQLKQLVPDARHDRV